MAHCCSNCAAGTDAFVEDDGQLVCMDCGQVVGGLISTDAEWDELGPRTNLARAGHALAMANAMNSLENGKAPVVPAPRTNATHGAARTHRPRTARRS